MTESFSICCTWVIDSTAKPLGSCLTPKSADVIVGLCVFEKNEKILALYEISDISAIGDNYNIVFGYCSGGSSNVKGNCKKSSILCLNFSIEEVWPHSHEEEILYEEWEIEPMKEVYSQKEEFDFSKIKMLNIHTPIFLSKEQQQQEEVEAIKHHLEEIFSSAVEMDIDPSNFNSCGVSTMSNISYSTFSVTETEHLIECKLTKHNEIDLLIEALNFYHSEIKFEEIAIETDPLSISNYLELYESFWNDFREKLNECSCLLQNYKYVKDEFKTTYFEIFNGNYEEIFELLLAGIQVKLLGSEEPSYLTLKKVYELIEAGGEVVINNFIDYIMVGFKQMLSNSFHSFEEEELKISLSIESAMKEVEEIAQIFSYLIYDQGTSNFHFSKTGSFEKIMSKTKPYISSNRFACNIVATVINEVTNELFFDKTTMKTFENEFLEQSYDERIEVLKNLIVLSQYCDYYNEISLEEDYLTIDKMEQSLCSLLSKELNEEVERAKEIATVEILENKEKYKLSEGLNLELESLESNYVFLMIKTMRFYRELVEYFENKESLQRDLDNTLINYYVLNNSFSDLSIQDVAFNAIDKILEATELYSLAKQYRLTQKTYEQFVFEEDLIIYSELEKDIDILLLIAFSTHSGNEQVILRKFVNSALLRMYVFKEASLKEETILSEKIENYCEENCFLEYYEEYIDIMIGVVEEESPLLICDEDAIEEMGFKLLQKTTTQCALTDSFVVTHGVENEKLVIFFNKKYGAVPAYCDAYIDNERSTNTHTVAEKSALNQERVIDEKIVEAIILREVKMEEEITVEELSEVFRLSQETVKLAVDSLTSLDLVKINDQGKITFEE